MTAGGLAIAWLASTAGCTQVSWYPIYGDCPPKPAAEVAGTRDGVDQVSTLSTERHFMRDYPMDGDETRTRISSPWLRVVLFPLNLVANMVSNAATGLVRPFKRSCCLEVPADVVEGLFYFGPLDAWHGYPFWEPTQLDARSLEMGWSL
jgi:hypothetical protein